MLSALFSSPSIKITLEEDLVFVHPIASDYPTADPVLRGTALVSLPSRRAIKNFKVVLEGACDAYGGAGWQYESSVTLHKELEQNFGGQFFEAGDHAFNFSFIIPSSTAVSQRSVHGRIRHYVKAHVEFDGGMRSTVVSSAPTAFWIAANSSAPGELPLPTDLSFQHYSSDLGPVGIGISSPHLTAAALCSVRLSLLGPPQNISIVSVKGIVTQTFEIEYKNGKVARPKPRQITLTKVDQTASPSLYVRIHNPATCEVRPGPVDPNLPPGMYTFPDSDSSSTGSNASDNGAPSTPEPSFRPESTCCSIKPDQPVVDPSPLAHVHAGEEFHYSRICRVPDDDHVRPTTLEGTDTKIRVGHKMSVEVRYRKDGDEEDMVLTIGKPITITSCCCLVDSMYLPAYSASSPPKTIVRPLQARCACNMSLKECFDRDGAALQRAGSISLPSSPPNLIGIDGHQINPSTKSPAWTNESPAPSPALLASKQLGDEEALSRPDSGYEEEASLGGTKEGGG
ncbi:hypothetical protein JCM6882_008278 [Rhodosporidiobolus microsporus]